DQRTVPTADVARIGSQAARALQAAARGDQEQMERASDAYAMMRRIAELLEGGVHEARVFVLTDGLSAARGLEPQTIGNVSVTFEIYDLRRL
ncbi:hypothetical protein, partial [Klebsiella aerogenes]